MKKLLTLIIFTFFLCGCTQISTQDCEGNNNLERCKVIKEAEKILKEAEDLTKKLQNNSYENTLIKVNHREMTIKQCFESYPDGVCELAQQGLEKQKQEQRKIANLLQRAETTSDLETKYQAAILYLNGENGVPRNPKKAEEYLMQLAKQGYVKSYVGLGSLYFNARDYKSAKYYFEMGAKKNDDVSKIYLGSLYENGLGVPKNIFQARKIYADVCNNGKLETKQAGCMMYDQLGR